MKLKLPRPVPSEFRISSPFQPSRTVTVDGNTTTRAHNGIDFAVPVGTDVRAAAEGIILRVGWENAAAPRQGYGLRIMQSAKIDGKTFFLWYGHLNELLVKEGQRVKAGQLIGKSGNTGHSTGPHLHFGARLENTGEFFDVDFVG
jgi:murein DD-endopeptidase MepM/ murein hydrolase activator NlpD